MASHPAAPPVLPLTFISDLASGRTTLRAAAGLLDADVDALVQLGAASLQAGRAGVAVRVFAGLRALDPWAPEHALGHALALHAAEERAAALDALDAIFSTDRPLPRDLHAEALRLQAELLAATDRPAAVRALAASRALDVAAPAAGGAR